MLLINLPPELLQLILLHSSTPSFVQWIRTCHTLFDLAAQSRDVITHHMDNVSTGKLVLSGGTVSTQELFLIFRRRAAASLQGVSITADRRDYYFPTASVDVSASCLTSKNDHNIALVRRGASSVQVYEVSQGQIKLRRVLDLECNDESTCRPLRTAFDELNNMYVLFSIEESSRKFSDPSHPCQEPSAAGDVTATSTLTRVRLSALACPHDSWDIGEMISGDSPSKEEIPGRPISMAAQGGNKVSIAWDSGACIDHSTYTSVALYTLLEDGEAHSLYADEIEEQYRNSRYARFTRPYGSRHAPSKVAFASGQTAVDCYSAGLATPMCRVSFKTDSTTEVTVRKMGVRVDHALTEWLFVEDHFFAYHKNVKCRNNTGSRSCRDVRLCFATGMLAKHKQTIGCILRSISTIQDDDCSHNLNPGQPHPSALDPRIEIVARLWGFKLPTTTLAAATAFTEQGTRIAIASWDRIFVWPLHPKELVETRVCHKVGNATYDQNLKCSLVELKPIVLEVDAVVHKMTFTASENELVTITDRGLQIWNLGPSAVGRRTVDLLYGKEIQEKNQSKNGQERCKCQKLIHKGSSGCFVNCPWSWGSCYRSRATTHRPETTSDHN